MVLRGQLAQSPQKALKFQAPDTKSSVDSAPPSCIVATGIPRLPPPASASVSDVAPLLHFTCFLQVLECVLFLIRILPVYLNSSSFNLQLSEEDINDPWLYFFTH